MIKKAAILIGLAAAGVDDHGPWNYKQNGADWPGINLGGNEKNECGGRNQSPIDLTANLPGSDQISSHEDNFQKLYTDQEKEIEI